MNQTRLIFLFNKAIHKEITQEERSELHKLLTENSSRKVVVDLFSQARAGFEYKDSFFSEGESSQLVNKVLGAAKPTDARIKRINIMKWVAAAMILTVIGVGFLFYKDHQPSLVKPENYAKDEIQPIRDKATLQLGNGKIVDLEALGGKGVQEGNVTISKTKEGQLIYKVAKGGEMGEIKRNILRTPRGGQFQVLLPDGSQVWLGPASSLTYPTRFEGEKREVELEGEAFLEVAKNQKMPFEVQTSDMTVHVMGTNFLISAYKDMNEATTTLLAGKVRVSVKSNSFNSSVKTLSPGQQVRINKQTKLISLQKVNLDDALAWKNGYFVFNGDDIQQVMKTIARWYDVDVIYKGDLSGETFIGTVSKFDRIDKLLQTIELTGGVHFKIEGREITVMR